jgi:hypothetical protein
MLKDRAAMIKHSHANTAARAKDQMHTAAAWEGKTLECCFVLHSDVKIEAALSLSNTGK